MNMSLEVYRYLHHSHCCNHHCIWLWIQAHFTIMSNEVLCTVKPCFITVLAMFTVFLTTIHNLYASRSGLEVVANMNWRWLPIVFIIQTLYLGYKLINTIYFNSLFLFDKQRTHHEFLLTCTYDSPKLVSSTTGTCLGVLCHIHSSSPSASILATSKNDSHYLLVKIKIYFTEEV